MPHELDRGRLSEPYGTVRIRRIEAGLTQEQLAEMSGLSVRTISDIDCGRTTRPRHSSVALLEAVLSQVDPGAGDRLVTARPRRTVRLIAALGPMGRRRPAGRLGRVLPWR